MRLGATSYVNSLGSILVYSRSEYTRLWVTLLALLPPQLCLLVLHQVRKELFTPAFQLTWFNGLLSVIEVATDED